MVAEVEFERAASLQALRKQGSRAALGRVRDDQLAEPAGVGADRVRAGQGQLVQRSLGSSHRVDGERRDAPREPGHAPDDNATRALDQSRRYIEDFNRTVARSGTPQEVIDEMLLRYPTYGNRYTVFVSAFTQFSS